MASLELRSNPTTWRLTLATLLILVGSSPGCADAGAPGGLAAGYEGPAQNSSVQPGGGAPPAGTAADSAGGDGLSGGTNPESGAGPAVSTGSETSGQPSDNGEAPTSTAEPSGPAEARSDNEPCAAPHRLRRLSNRRYGKAVRDLLGLDEAPLLTGGGGRVDTLVPGDARLLSEDLAFEYSQAAAEAAEAAELSLILPCEMAAGDRACAADFISSFGLRAFRRPATPEEVEQLLTVYDAGAEAGFEAGIRLLLQAILQAPSFLYQGSLSPPDDLGTIQLSSYDVAEMLGMLFLDSVPDAELLEAAALDALSTDHGVSTEVERLLTLPSVRTQLSWVLDGWFGGTAVRGKAKDPQLFPDYSTELSESLWQSKHRFIDQLLWEAGGGLEELFTSDRVWVDARLAEFLGVPPPSTGEWELVDVPSGQRAGIVTHPALMAQLASTDETSVVHRGLFLYHTVLCLPIAPPPAGALEQGLAVAEELENERQRAEYRAEQPTCGGCHSTFDPYGLAFEKYDAAGRYVPQADANASVSTPASIAGNYTDATGLMASLATAPEVAQCASKQLVSYALERVAGPSESCVVDQVYANFAESPGALMDLFRSLASARSMYLRVENSP